MALSFFTVFDKFLLTRLMHLLSPNDLINFSTSCRKTRAYVTEYLECIISPDLIRLFASETRTPHITSAFRNYVNGFNVNHPHPFTGLTEKNMIDYWRMINFDRICVYQSFINFQIAIPDLYIKQSLESERFSEPPSEPCAFDVKHFYNERKPFHKSCLLRASNLIEMTSDCILPVPGTYECWVQIYIFTNSYLPHLDVGLNGSKTVTSKHVGRIVLPTDDNGKLIPGVFRTKVGEVTSKAEVSHAILRLWNTTPTAQPYARVAFDYVVYIPLQPYRKDTKELINKKRKFELLN